MFLLLLSICAPCRADVRNLTEENRKALSSKVTELRRSELLRVARGRVKANPVLLPLFTAYQTVLVDQKLLLSRQLDDYRGTLMEMQRIRGEFPDFLDTPLGKQVSALYDSRVAEAYSVKKEIEEADSMILIWHAFNISRYRMQMAPVEFRLAINTGNWLSRATPGGVPPEAAASEFLGICSMEYFPNNVFEADKLLSELSAKFSSFFLEYTRRLKAEK